MKKSVCVLLMFVLALSFMIGVVTAEAKAPPWKGQNLIQCIWRCHIEKGILYNCCRVVMPGGGGKMTCTEIGEC